MSNISNINKIKGLEAEREEARNNPRNEINITVSGLPASGKSRMLYIIKKMLADDGFNITHKMGPDFENEELYDTHMSNNIEQLVSEFKETKRISIREIPLNRTI